MSCFVFLWIGQDVTVPRIFVRSIRMKTAQARVIQCSDAETPTIDGVDDVRRLDGDTSKLMTYRLQSFSELGLRETAMYMDADMVCVRGLDAKAILGDAQIAVCRREYEETKLINVSYRGIDLSEYYGKTGGEVWPYIACFTVSESSDFWADCLARLKLLNPKFHTWYGDQEAIRDVVRSGKYRVKLLRESVYGCLPDEKSPAMTPRLLHFKGKRRKHMMLEWAARNNLA